MEKIAFSAVLFDLDGTLIDSESNYAISDGRLFADFGIDFDDSLRRSLIGKGSEEFIRLLRESFGVAESRDALIERKNAYYLEVARANTRVFPEMFKLLETLHGRGIPTAVASGSPLFVIREMLSGLDLERYLDVVVASEEVERGKPFPDVFLEAAKRLGTPPASCLVFEDSPYGVEAAEAAGMKSVAIPTITEPPLHGSFFRADRLYAGGMEEFTAEDILARIRYVPLEAGPLPSRRT